MKHLCGVPHPEGGPPPSSSSATQRGAHPPSSSATPLFQLPGLLEEARAERAAQEAARFVLLKKARSDPEPVGVVPLAVLPPPSTASADPESASGAGGVLADAAAFSPASALAAYTGEKEREVRGAHSGGGMERGLRRRCGPHRRGGGPHSGVGVREGPRAYVRRRRAPSLPLCPLQGGRSN